MKKATVRVRNSHGRRKVATAALLLIAGVLAAAKTASAQATLRGAGSTFAYPVYSKWFSAYQSKDPSISFEYQYVGSSEGIKRFLARAVDFGATDAVLGDAQIKEVGKHVLHLPTFAGAVVVTYNLPVEGTLNLDAGTTADLFLGKITKWNDERLAKLNPEFKLPDLPVVVVHRSDGSGTTNIFTEYLSKVNPEWREKVGAGKTVPWPTGKSEKGNRGVVELVKTIPGAVTYAEHAAVSEHGLPDAAMMNQSGSMVRATAESIQAALDSAVIPEDLRFGLTNAPGSGAYPIAGATWLIVYDNDPDLKKNRKMVQFFTWAMNEGDAIVRSKTCVPLPSALKKSVLAKLKRIKTP